MEKFQHIKLLGKNVKKTYQYQTVQWWEADQRAQRWAVKDSFSFKGSSVTRFFGFTYFMNQTILWALMRSRLKWLCKLIRFRAKIFDFKYTKIRLHSVLVSRESNLLDNVENDSLKCLVKIQ